MMYTQIKKKMYTQIKSYCGTLRLDDSNGTNVKHAITFDKPEQKAQLPRYVSHTGSLFFIKKYIFWITFYLRVQPVWYATKIASMSQNCILCAEIFFSSDRRCFLSWKQICKYAKCPLFHVHANKQMYT